MMRMAEGRAGGAEKKKKKPLLLGRYEVGRLLGQGSFAKVYHARSAATGEEVAIKVMEKERILRSGAAAHVKREIAVLRRVRHPNIVQLHEVMATRLRIYFVMEYVRGGELFARVARGRLREDAARRYFQQLVSAVAFCHARGVFHRDIKPENLLVDDRGDLRVSDFGLSAAADQMRHDGLFHTFCGTPAYVAPEVLSRKGYDAAKADLWSCGVVLFVLMAGYLPFRDRNLVAMYRKIHRGEFRCPKWFSPELVQLLRRILDTAPHRRCTADEIMDNAWFKKGFRRFSFRVEDDRSFTCFDLDADADADGSTSAGSELGPRLTSSTSAPSLLEADLCGGLGGSMRRPASLNAFDIISFSRGFDLSRLFEAEGHMVEGARFVSAAPVERIVARLEEVAGEAGMSVRAKGGGAVAIGMEGTMGGAHGRGALAVAAEISELTPELVVVEVRMEAGDRAEYEMFFRTQLEPGLLELLHDGGQYPPAAELSRSL